MYTTLIDIDYRLARPTKADAFSRRVTIPP